MNETEEYFTAKDLENLLKNNEEFEKKLKQYFNSESFKQQQNLHLSDMETKHEEMKDYLSSRSENIGKKLKLSNNDEMPLAQWHALQSTSESKINEMLDSKHIDNKLQSLNEKLQELKNERETIWQRYLKLYFKNVIQPQIYKKYPGMEDIINNGSEDKKRFVQSIISQEMRNIDIDSLYDNFINNSVKRLSQNINDIDMQIKKLSNIKEKFVYANNLNDNPLFLSKQQVNNNVTDDDIEIETDEDDMDDIIREKEIFSFVNEICNNFDLGKVSKYLGKGVESDAFLLDNGNVLKFTQYNNVMKSWQNIYSLKNNKLRHLAEIYKIGRVDDNIGRPRENQYGFCVMEYIRPLNGLEQQNYVKMTFEIDKAIEKEYNNGETLYDVLKANKFNSFFIDKIYKMVKDSEVLNSMENNFLYQYLDMMAELGKFNLGTDIHCGNVGIRKNGELAVYDFS